MTDTTKTEALRLADLLESAADNSDMGRPKDKRSANRRAAAELRRLSFMEAERDQLRDAMKYRSEALNLMREAAEQFRADRDRLAAECEALRACATKYLGWLNVKNPAKSLEQDITNPEMIGEAGKSETITAAMGGKESQGGNASGQKKEAKP